MIASAWIHYFFIFRLIALVCAHDRGTTLTSTDELPKTSTDFIDSYSWKGAEELPLLSSKDDDSFFRWVLLARHTTWLPGWEVAMPRGNNMHMNVTEDEKHQYVRVFDLLNWSRKQNLLPVPADISSICHKGMEVQYNTNMGEISRGDNERIPPIPNAFIPTEMWSNLWNTCNKKLLSSSRISSSCIDIPGILVANPSPPLKINNPCNLEYRMVDGAHRICLRKYLLTLLTGELKEL
ncbi:hypothetical protein ACHAXR_010896, partial [Thalassiosira sp. AJA248-18]